MLYGQSSSQPSSQGASPQPSPASLFIQRLQGIKPSECDTPAHPAVSISIAPSSVSKPESAAGGYVGPMAGLEQGAALGPSMPSGVSFGEAGSNLSSPTYRPPVVARHPLFSHHAAARRQSSFSQEIASSLSFLSDPGPSGPPSPTVSDMSNLSLSAFSPASTFLSHFSAPMQNALPLDAEGAQVLNYKLGKVIGRGGFSTVRKAINMTTNEVVACKIVKRDDLSDRSGSLEKFEEEIQIWQQLPRHPSLLSLLEMHRTDSITFLFSPYMPGGSLLDVLRREGGSDKTARKWFPGVVAAVSVLHEGFPGFSGGLLHGDLKLDNFLVDSRGTVMACDFYMAKWIDKEKNTSTIPPPLNAGGMNRHSTLPSNFSRGRHPSPYQTANSHQLHRPPYDGRDDSHTPVQSQPFPSASLPYAPPELLRAPPSRASLAQDMWAVGIILHALLTSRLPFVDAFDPRLQMKILRGSWEEPPNLGREWLDCLHGCLDGDVDRRWTIRQVRESDAVMGWAEVKSRGKSRSRSRARGRGLVEGLLDGIRRDGSQPVPITSPMPRGKLENMSRSRDRCLQGDSVFPGESMQRGSFSRLSHRDDDRRTPRSRSASASRSRSSGSHQTIFTFDAPELARGLEAVDTRRGRSKQRNAPVDKSNLPISHSNLGSMYTKPQGMPHPQRMAAPVPSGSNPHSRSQSAQRGLHPQSAPAQSSGFKTSMNMGLNEPLYNRSPMPITAAIPISSSSQSRSQSRHSQSGSSPSTSRSISRARGDGNINNKWGESPTPPSVNPLVGTRWEILPERYEYGQELGAVHEEERGRDKGTRSRDTSRSQSRGRRGRPANIGNGIGGTATSSNGYVR
ncbi:uncharacterized protein L203_105148 [Cryptococcus depauperatus CBS 7841]|uniref:Uncharacterized protein n=1 Tax=Cryptococcus depauperatus CBS 7841 TaxID=1295531 RepID=A0A1E3HVC3_9TREE|nr:serine/threonine protein kinase [Cryptococcus depauperatus CBS 7841]